MRHVLSRIFATHELLGGSLGRLLDAVKRSSSWRQFSEDRHGASSWSEVVVQRPCTGLTGDVADARAVEALTRDTHRGVEQHLALVDRGD